MDANDASENVDIYLKTIVDQISESSTTWWSRKKTIKTLNGYHVVWYYINSNLVHLVLNKWRVNNAKKARTQRTSLQLTVDIDRKVSWRKLGFLKNILILYQVLRKRRDIYINDAIGLDLIMCAACRPTHQVVVIILWPHLEISLCWHCEYFHHPSLKEEEGWVGWGGNGDVVLNKFVVMMKYLYIFLFKIVIRSL